MFSEKKSLNSNTGKWCFIGRGVWKLALFDKNNNLGFHPACFWHGTSWLGQSRRSKPPHPNLTPECMMLCVYIMYKVRVTLHIHSPQNLPITIKGRDRYGSWWVAMGFLVGFFTLRLSPFLTGRMFVCRTYFGQFDELYFVLNWLVMRFKLRPELAADAQQTAWSRM